MQASKPSSQSHILSLTGLRGIACLLVMLCHCSLEGLGWANTLRHSGLPAVYLFFVLSGYLLMKRGLQDIQPSRDSVPQRFFGWKLITFLIRRFMRVYPAYFVAIVTYKIMVWYVRSSGHGCSLLSDYDRSMWKSLYFHGMSYHFWTLRIELFFFLAVLPIILVITAEAKNLDYTYFRNSRCQPSHIFYLIVTMIMMFIQNSDVAYPSHEEYWAHMPAFWHGCLGGIASYHFKISNMKIPTDTPLRKKIVELITWGIVFRLALGNEGLVATLTNLNPVAWWNNFYFQTPWKAALLFVLEFTYETNSIARALSLPLFQFLGKTSYSVYLMHMLVLILYRMHSPIRGAEGTLEMIIFSFVVGAILYYTVEERGVKYGEELLRWLRSSSKTLEAWSQSLEIYSKENILSDIEIASLKVK